MKFANIVVICFQFSIFVLSGTPSRNANRFNNMLWFAFNLVSLFYQEHPYYDIFKNYYVVICFQFSIFVLSGTPASFVIAHTKKLWFAFNLVSLFYQEHRRWQENGSRFVVICFQFSIFVLSGTPLFDKLFNNSSCDLLSI